MHNRSLTVEKPKDYATVLMWFEMGLAVEAKHCYTDNKYMLMTEEECLSEYFKTWRDLLDYYINYDFKCRYRLAKS